MTEDIYYSISFGSVKTSNMVPFESMTQFDTFTTEFVPTQYSMGDKKHGQDLTVACGCFDHKTKIL